MENEQIWLIGAADNCHFVFEVPSVSGVHCQIQKVDQGYLLTDSDSTNGTYVNGGRVLEPTLVTPQDEIRLGAVALFPWELLGERSSLRVIRIGRSPNNNIVIDDPSVSYHHAQLVSNGQQTIIQDLGSTNGTAVDRPNNKIDSIELIPTSIVYLGNHIITGAKLLKSTKLWKDKVNNFWIENWRDNFSESEKFNLIAFTIAMVLLLILILGFIIY